MVLSSIGCARWVLCCVVMVTASAAGAGGLNQLQSFLSQTQAGDSTFSQEVFRPPSKDASGSSVPQRLTGRMRFKRPDRFRFDYLTPYVQTIVGDGQNLWLYDPDLAQVTVRSQAQTLADSPAGLIATATGLDQLRRHFTLSEGPDADGVAWVVATPKNAEALLTQVRLGLAGNVLQVLEMTDALGQRTRLAFGAQDQSQTVADGVFRFTVPDGVDVIRQ